MFGVLHYAALRRGAIALCESPEAKANEGVLRVCKRRIFRYTSRMGLKTLLSIYCALQTYIAYGLAQSPISEAQWSSALVMTAILVWLTADTLLVWQYD